MKKKIDYNALLGPFFARRREGMKWTEWSAHLKKIKVRREWVSIPDSHGYSSYSQDPDSEEILRIINSYKTSRFVYVIGGHKYKRGNYGDMKCELLLVPRNLAQKILVLGGVP
jgi:hypothetical protein